MIRKYSIQILNGLRYLHAHNVVHGDLKVSNLLLDHMGSLKLTDYGIHKKIAELLDPSKASKTVDYWTTSVMEHEEHDLELEKKKDILTLGYTILEMTGNSAKKKGGSLPDNLSRDAREFLSLCFKRNPEDRPDVTALMQHPFVQDISSTMPTNWIPLSPPPTPPPSSFPQAKFHNELNSTATDVS